MTMESYMNYARSFGYDIRFTGIGMGYVTLGQLALTAVMDADKAEKELAMLGMAIMTDTVRAM